MFSNTNNKQKKNGKQIEKQKKIESKQNQCKCFKESSIKANKKKFRFPQKNSWNNLLNVICELLFSFEMEFPFYECVCMY